MLLRKPTPVFSFLPQSYHSNLLYSEFSDYAYQRKYLPLVQHCFYKLNPYSTANAPCQPILLQNRRICLSLHQIETCKQAFADNPCYWYHVFISTWLIFSLTFHSWETVDGYIWSEQTIWSNLYRCLALNRMCCNPTEQRGKTPLISVELMPVTVEPNLRESGSLFCSSGAHAPKFTTGLHCARLVYLWDSSSILS